jgi:hypothetical protein
VVICILKFIKSKIRKLSLFSTDMILTFEDRKITKNQYSFIKNHLDKYEWYIDDEYSMTSKTIYNESSGMLLIVLDIIIPDRLMPKDDDILTQMIKDHFNRFPSFYERNLHLYKPEKEQELVLNPCYVP